MSSKLCVYVATGETIADPLKKLCHSLNIECQETKMHVGDIMIAQILESENTLPLSKQITNLTEPSETMELTRTQIIMENLPQIQKQSPDLIIEPLLLIERKTIEDFCQSLTSQHKKEQTLRMLQYRQNLGCSLRLTFVIEGYLQFKDADAGLIYEKTPLQLESAFIKLQHRDQIAVQQVYNLKDHLTWIKYYLNILQHEPDLGYRQRNLYQEYLHQALKIDKKSNLTPETTYLTQLTCFQTVSMTMAQAMAKQYGSFKSLFRAWNVDPKPEKMLADILIPASKPGGPSRRLGPVRSANIYQAMNTDHSEMKILNSEKKPEVVSNSNKVSKPLFRIK